MVDGKPMFKFKSARGLRLGGLLSLTLFNIVMDMLS